jgi:2-keto-4-pentenoate hydratase/2-oxohepta-3-ene-1,7-dioic acid hydratase in catechol pathway
VRLANHRERAVIVLSDTQGADVETASAGAFGPGLSEVYSDWGEFTAWAAAAQLTADVEFDRASLGSPSPEPRQVFAIGLNYGDHAAETGFEKPDRLPPVFSKFVTSISGPQSVVHLPPGGSTDWEVELVAVISKRASNVAAVDAWDHVAGLSVGQDLSERESQMAGPAPQFGLAKSFAGFSPIGPWLVTPDEFSDPDDLELGCSIDGETMQLGRTRDLLFPVSELVERLSRVVTLLPGDVIFTGTPAGVGMGRKPPRYLKPKEVLVSWIEGIGQLEQTFH